MKCAFGFIKNVGLLFFYSSLIIPAILHEKSEVDTSHNNFHNNDNKAMRDNPRPEQPETQSTTAHKMNQDVSNYAEYENSL